VRLGRTIERQVEVLSGLVAGEKIVVDDPASPGGH
jgi:multidrug efflux pump subunit AcrA (membrane-fusion protein)